MSRWYILEDGVLQEHPGFAEADKADETNEARATPFLPWTVQERIAGFAEVDGKLHCGVNGAGVAVFELEARAGTLLPHLYTVHNTYLFTGRTIGSIFSYDGTVYCHLYRNTLFDTAPPKADPVSLVGLAARERRFRVTVLSFQANHPEWEVVELLPAAEGPWHLAYKYSGKDKTAFRYSQLDLDTRQEREIGREAFRSRYRFSRPDSLPPPVVRLADRYFAGVDTPRYEGGPAVIHISVQSPGSPVPERYRIGDLSDLGKRTDRILRISGFRRGESWVFLLPEGELFRMSAPGAGIKTTELPPLPPGFVYTDLWAGEDAAAVSWEEQRFAEVGRAGMLVVPLD